MPNKWLTICALMVVSVSATLAESDFVDSAALHDAGLMKYWQLQLPIPEDQKVVSAWRVDDAIYVATDGARVYALHAHTGAFRWMKEVTTAAYIIRRPCHIGSLVVFVLPSEVRLYDRYNGQPAWRMELDFPAGTPAVSDGERLFIGGIDQRMYAFLPYRDYEEWKARTTGQIVAAPAVLDKYLYYASDDGGIYACTADRKRHYWSTRVYGNVSANLVADQNGIYVATLEHSLFLLDPAFGGLRWRVQLSGALAEPPVLTKDVVFQYSPAEGVVAVNTGPQSEVTNRIRWTLANGRSLLTADETKAYLLSNDEQLLVANLTDGKVQKTIPATGFTIPIPSPADKGLFVADATGRVFCARKAGSPVITAADVQEALRRPNLEEEKTEEAADVAGAETVEDPLDSDRPGPAVGGKSKVSREYGGG